MATTVKMTWSEYMNISWSYKVIIMTDYCTIPEERSWDDFLRANRIDFS